MARPNRSDMTAEQILRALQRTIRKSDSWRGYIGDDDESPTDGEMIGVLDDCLDALAFVNEYPLIFEAWLNGRRS